MDKIAALIRHALTTGAGFLVGAGYLDNAQAESIIGGLMAVLAVGWSLYAKTKKDA